MVDVTVEEVTVAVLESPTNQVSVTAPGPAGGQGPAGTITVGTVTDFPYGTPPTVVNVGTPQAAILNFGIERGPQGIAGAGFTQSGPFTVPQGNNDNLTGEIFNYTLVDMVDYITKVKRSSTAFVRVEFTLMYRGGLWALVFGGERYEDAANESEVAFTVDPVTAQVKAQNLGTGSVIIYVQKNAWPT